MTFLFARRRIGLRTRDVLVMVYCGLLYRWRRWRCAMCILGRLHLRRGSRFSRKSWIEELATCVRPSARYFQRSTPCDDEMRQGWPRCEVLRSKSDFRGRCAARVAVSWLSVMPRWRTLEGLTRCHVSVGRSLLGFSRAWTLEEPWL